VKFPRRQGYEGHWNDCKVMGPYSAKRENIDDVGFLHALVDRLVKDHNADRARVPHPAMHGWRLLGNSNRDIHAANEIWEFFQSMP
jgi:poly(3-hydroxybutyrate) depolymerase